MTEKQLESEVTGKQNEEEAKKLFKLLGTRRGKLGVLTRKKNEINVLIEAAQDKETVLKQIRLFEGYFSEFKELQVAVQSLLKDEYEMEADKLDWYEPKLIFYQGFLEGVYKWAEGKDDEMEEDGEEDEVEEDGEVNPIKASQASVPQSCKAASARSSRISGASRESAHLRAEAECAALKAKSRVLTDKLELDVEEAKLKARRERVALESELAAAEARVRVYRESEVKPLPGGYRYDVTTEHKIPATTQRPARPHREDVASQRDSVQLAQEPISPHVVSRQPAQFAGSHSEANQHITDVLKKQTEITELLVKQQTLSLLPDREIPVFDGDALHYRTFIKAFEQCIERNTTMVDDRLYYLQQYTKGQPRSLVTSFLHMDPTVGYMEAKKQLEFQFGNRFKIASAFMTKALNWPVIKPEDGTGLRSYALFLRSCYHTMQDIDGLRELENSTNLRQIASKLPFRLRDKWRVNVCNMQDQDKRVTYKDLVEFIEKQSRTMLDPVFGDLSSSSTVETKTVFLKPKPQTVGSKPRDRASFATTVVHVPGTRNNECKQKTNSTAFERPCLFCEKNHTFEHCELFQSRPNTERIEYMKTNGMCFGCLTKGHVSRTCKKKMTCEKCSLSHPTILHILRDKQKDDRRDDHVLPASSAMVSVKDDMHTGETRECTLAIVPVKVKMFNSDKIIHTYAFLDPGSSATFCADSLKRKLNAPGKNCKILLRTMGQERPVSSSVVSGLEISNMTGQTFHKLPEVYTQTKLPVSKHHIPKQDSINKWKYLHEVKIPQVDADIELLVGTNAAKLMEPWKIINSRGSGPYAVKTPLGWVLNGLMQETTCEAKGIHSCAVVNRISVANLNDLLIQQYQHDFPELKAEEKTEMSIADKRFMSIMESSKELRNGHYYLPLPFKDNDVTMPSNYQQAQQRVLSLKRKLERNAHYHKEYTTFLESVIEKGYAETVPSDELKGESGTVWYMPHHGVHHPKKGTLRVVFDCSASFQGISLNSKLIQGPNLTSNLVGVLLRFRQEPIALMADIESMFHQVRVADRHVNFLRFLWWPNGDTSQPLREYRMTVHIFGATSSPSCASFALRQTAEDFKDFFSRETMETIKCNFYVDDCLKSVTTEADAIMMCKELESACAMGGFRLHKWISNSRNVLMSIPQADRAKEVKDLDLESSDLPVERSLGIQWHVERDQLTFAVSLKDQPCTRRGILSIIASVYDPLGFICPFVLTAKSILQDLCRQNYAWDKELQAHYVQMWQEWLTGLSHIRELVVSRCMKPMNFGQVTSAQLHHFSDASEGGYGCVSYLRLENAEENVHISFLMGKARVAPLKHMTMPRLELTAAVLAVRMDKLIKTELQLILESSVFWSDSTSVLKYIKNENKRFKTFVANRVSTIRELTKVQQWRHIGTKLNPADCASRGLRASALLHSTTWLDGPDFLKLQECEWPNSDFVPQQCGDDDVEVKRDVVVMATIANEQNPTHVFIQYHSKWSKLLRAVAWMLKLKNVLLHLSQKRKEMMLNVNVKDSDESKPCQMKEQMQVSKKCINVQPISLDDLKTAEHAVIQFAQIECYSEEIETLQKGDTYVSRQSTIRKLDPLLKGGLLHTGGRLSRMAMPEDQKHPVILPKHHHVSKLVLKQVHEQLGHCGRNHMLSKLRQRYWIPAANALARKICSECVLCKRQHSNLGEQKMADLPKERLTPDLPPFSFVGADYFGPITVKRGRSDVKRYGVIFTCLTTSSTVQYRQYSTGSPLGNCLFTEYRFMHSCYSQIYKQTGSGDANTI